MHVANNVLGDSPNPHTNPHPPFTSVLNIYPSFNKKHNRLIHEYPPPPPFNFTHPRAVYELTGNNRTHTDYKRCDLKKPPLSDKPFESILIMHMNLLLMKGVLLFQTSNVDIKRMISYHTRRPRFFWCYWGRPVHTSELPQVLE